ncbi:MULTISPECIES: hypothetical protein [unclassified Rhodococcus (in: high G+C Gram-positive bacteria)]|uniref:hypothetical protein n=1 Tax=unclassified Rhodococcus (in: high G+C Gram-positive bacteria) TaxID=192944 RepID=UPI000B9BA51E|nr:MULTISPECIES: hypothetical protein [unclassified Rhodococcus (in: high G+C Gram-positive bacteria)]OZE35662.1 hypothetical protein CH259_16695 [Rhodococcus sp. 05-2254-4]OZE48091.1 hypothetical protein CH261_09290 [Rhodococcus sp. 05-2254-3]OZE49302.1 hypothetical protein CH283_17075 [Rhodococcus sp. 05-2254-2]
MTFIARGEVYDGYPMGADCDLDALIVGVMIPNLIQITADAITAALQVSLTRILPRFWDSLPVLPAAAGLGGAGSLVPVSGLATAPGTPNETRNE